MPPHAHPLAKTVFRLMAETRTTYEALQHFSGVQRTTLKSYRSEKYPGIRSIEALLGAFGWRLAAVPPLDALPEHVREALDEISLHFRSDDEVLAAAIATFAKKTEPQNDAEPLRYRAADWLRFG